MRKEIFRNKTIMEEFELILYLKEIKWSEHDWDSTDMEFLVRSMLTHIGSTDSELRDKLIYSSFYRLIVEYNLLNQEFLKEILDYCLHSLLFKGIGDNGTDTVFTRAFTTLLIALILHRDNMDNFIKEQEIVEVCDKLVDYIEREADLRGFVQDKGWAHSIAHASDALYYLVKNPKLQNRYFSVILQKLFEKVLVSKSVYLHDEDERLLEPILEMLERGLSSNEVIWRIEKLTLELKQHEEEIPDDHYWQLVCNCKNFLKSFYFKIQVNGIHDDIQRSIVSTMKKIDGG